MDMDPVCHMEVDPGSAMWSSEHKGRTYHFCARVCKALFDEDPELFVE